MPAPLEPLDADHFKRLEDWARAELVALGVGFTQSDVDKLASEMEEGIPHVKVDAALVLLDRAHDELAATGEVFSGGDLMRRAAEIGDRPRAPVVTADRIVTGSSTRGIIGGRVRKHMAISRLRSTLEPEMPRTTTFKEEWYPFLPILLEDPVDQRESFRVCVDSCEWAKGRPPSLVVMRLAFSNGDPDELHLYAPVRRPWWSRFRTWFFERMY